MPTSIITEASYPSNSIIKLTKEGVKSQLGLSLAEGATFVIEGTKTNITCEHNISLKSFCLSYVKEEPYLKVEKMDGKILYYELEAPYIPDHLFEKDDEDFEILDMIGPMEDNSQNWQRISYDIKLAGE